MIGVETSKSQGLYLYDHDYTIIYNYQILSLIELQQLMAHPCDRYRLDKGGEITVWGKSDASMQCHDWCQ
jgi:hypothetical protein